MDGYVLTKENNTISWEVIYLVHSMNNVNQGFAEYVQYRHLSRFNGYLYKIETSLTRTL